MAYSNYERKTTIILCALCLFCFFTIFGKSYADGLVLDPAIEALDAFEGKILKRNDPKVVEFKFKPHELPFEINEGHREAAAKTPKSENVNGDEGGTTKAKEEKKPILSKKFFAVILRTTKRCGIKERERAKIQKLIPTNKVFFENYKCDDDQLQNYSAMKKDRSFLAVYGGRTREEARALYERERLEYLFLGSRIKQIRAIRHVE